MLSPDTEQLVERSERLYEERLKAELEANHLHEFVAIEPESGEYFLGPTLSDAAAACRAAHPNRRVYVVRVGHRAAIEMPGLTLLRD
jgi:hypothetical protein